MVPSIAPVTGRVTGKVLALPACWEDGRRLVSEHAQRLLGGAAGFRGPHDQLLLGIVGAGVSRSFEGEVADQRMAYESRSSASDGDVVAGPPAAEVLVTVG
jgi:hypothetical protein